VTFDRKLEPANYYICTIPNRHTPRACLEVFTYTY
jgi:hypothetical protein